MTQNFVRALFPFVLIGSLALGSPAVGGVLDAPDDSGPSTTDFTGFTTVYLFLGAWSDLGDDIATVVYCLNVGQVDTTVGVQLFDTGGSVPASPDMEGDMFIPAGGARSLESIESANFANFGNLVAVANPGPELVGRVLVNEKKAKVICRATVVDAAAGGDMARELTMISIKKESKPKLAKK